MSEILRICEENIDVLTGSMVQPEHNRRTAPTTQSGMGNPDAVNWLNPATARSSSVCHCVKRSL